jgi:hypothetical protein
MPTNRCRNTNKRFIETYVDYVELISVFPWEW